MNIRKLLEGHVDLTVEGETHEQVCVLSLTLAVDPARVLQIVWVDPETGIEWENSEPIDLDLFIKENSCEMHSV